MEYAEAVEQAPPGWRHFTIEDVARLPEAVRRHEMARIPDGEPGERIIRALFWTLVYHLEPEKWDELARHEPIHPDLIHALPSGVDIALDVGAGSGRLTQQLVTRSRRVVAVEPSAGLRAILTRRLPAVSAVAGWAESLPLEDGCSHLTAASGAFGPDPPVLAELRRVTAPGGMIALISPVTYACPVVSSAGVCSLTACAGVTQDTDGNVPAFASAKKSVSGRMSES